VPSAVANTSAIGKWIAEAKVRLHQKANAS
jgi:hypothetical protein